MIKGTVLVTGASGFVGKAIIPALLALGWKVRAAVRPSSLVALPDGVERVASPDITNGLACDWRPALEGCQRVLHLAARVHMMNDRASDPLSAFRWANRDSARALAEQSVEMGLARMVLVSSVKVNGEGTKPGQVYRADDPPKPADPYGISKAEAEQALWAVTHASHLEGVVVRPPLVYGPGVKANFAALMAAVQKGRWLPLGAVDNYRSLISVANLASALAVAVDHPAAAGQTFLVSDGEDLSTADLVRRLAHAFGCPPHLLAVPPLLLRVMLTMVGKGAVADRLLGSLVVDSTPLRLRCGWVPPQTLDHGLAEAVAGFQA